MLKIFGLFGCLNKNSNVDTENEELVFLNLPLEEEDRDLIGISKYVKKISYAIERNAQFIAVTSEYGAGKTSLIKRLETHYNGKKKIKFFKINLWTSLLNETPVLEIHKSFLYQLSTQIDIDKGTYINKRLSKNFGLLSIASKSTLNRILTILTIFLSMLILFIGYQNDYIQNIFIYNFPDYIFFYYFSKIILYLITTFLIIYLIFNADILFSTNKSEGNRSVEENDLVDLYRRMILEKRFFNFGRCHYIIVLEDLDRTDDKIKVFQFLKEFRKYYQPSDSNLKNSATFIINLKSEAELKIDQDSYTDGNIFSKIFDYVINIQKINIDDYEIILNGLIDEKKESLKRISLNRHVNRTELKIYANQWLLRGLTQGIREIKERLNYSITLYETLCIRFNQEDIDYLKCSVAAYIMVKFACEFNRIKDNTFQLLIEEYVKERGIGVDKIKYILDNENIMLSQEFIREIKILIESLLIDTNYRIYFYNYPKGSHLYSNLEREIFDYIYYKKDNLKKFDDLLLLLNEDKNEVIFDVLKKLDNLELSYPNSVILNERTFNIALGENYNGLQSTIDSLSFDEKNVETTFGIFKSMLNFSYLSIEKRTGFFKYLAYLVLNKSDRKSLIQFRLIICKNFMIDIEKFSSLYYESNTIISNEEILEFKDISYLLKFTKYNSDEYDYDSFLDVHDRVINLINSNKSTDILTPTSYAVLMEFYNRQTEIFEEEDIAAHLLELMICLSKIDEHFEEIIIKFIDLSDEIKELYIKLINTCSDVRLPQSTLKIINENDFSDELNVDVANQMYSNGYILDYILIQSNLNIIKVDFKDTLVIKCIKDNYVVLFNKYNNKWKLIRYTILKEFQEIINNYLFLFNDQMNIISEIELSLTKSISISLELISIKKVDLISLVYISKFFNFDIRRKNDAYLILNFVSKLSSDLAYKLFYLLDFNKIQYSRISKNNKSTLKNTLFKILKLDLSAEIINFMFHTRHIDEELEKLIVDQILIDLQLQEKYVDLLNNLKDTTSISISLLSKFIKIYIYDDLIIERMYLDGYLRSYVLFSIVKIGYFQIDLDRENELWETYIDIFRSNQYLEYALRMSENKEFIIALVENKEYYGLEKSLRLTFSKVYQDYDMLDDLVSYPISFIIEYLSQIDGFTSRDSADKFLDLVLNNDSLLISEQIYNNCYDKLLDSQLKSKYTRERNKLLS